MRNIDTYKERYMERLKFRRTLIIFQIVGLVILTVGLIATCQGKREQDKIINSTSMMKCHTRLTEKQWKLAKYFHKVGSPKPVEMAIACSVTKKPRLMAAMAKVETHGDPTKRKTGYKKRHDGAWQVNRYDWGRVSHNTIEQALQAQDALEDFVKMSKGDIKKALAGYGGDSTDAYSRKVLAELRNVP